MEQQQSRYFDFIGKATDHAILLFLDLDADLSNTEPLKRCKKRISTMCSISHITIVFTSISKEISEFYENWLKDLLSISGKIYVIYFEPEQYPVLERQKEMMCEKLLHEIIGKFGWNFEIIMYSDDVKLLDFVEKLYTKNKQQKLFRVLHGVSIKKETVDKHPEKYGHWNV